MYTKREQSKTPPPTKKDDVQLQTMEINLFQPPRATLTSTIFWWCNKSLPSRLDQISKGGNNKRVRSH
eukprot:15334851-Ditylum_brightwellii.AAC.1